MGISEWYLEQEEKCQVEPKQWTKTAWGKRELGGVLKEEGLT